MIREFLGGISLRRLVSGLSDLGVVLGFVILADVSLLATSSVAAPVRLAVEVGVVLFCPGYLAVAALFPSARGTGGSGSSAGQTQQGIDLLERLGLSLGAGITIVLLVGFALNLSRWGVTRLPLLVALNVVVVLTALLAIGRRAALPPDERFRVSLRGGLSSVAGGLGQRRSVLDIALTVVLVASLLVAVASVGYAIGVPSSGENYTEFYVLTERDDGGLVADDYPTTIQRGGTEQVVLRIRNREHRPQRYTIVVGEQRLTGNDSAQTTAQQELDRVRVAPLDHNGTATQRYDITPTTTGDRVRITFLLFRGDPPQDAVGADAYRRLHLTVSVPEQGG
jgi:uncharacterized membrane protein